MDTPTLFFDDLADCMIGFACPWDTSGQRLRRAVYSAEKIIDHFMQEGMTMSEAIEYISFNVEGAYVGPTTPIVVWEEEEAE